MKNKSKISNIITILGKVYPLIVIALVTLLIFFKIFLKGLYPIPGDLLVSFYFPWYSGGWPGYDPWTTHKELLNADAIRQIYLWKEFAADQFARGHFPLWNPYTFSGQPLAANFQSSVYYPLNLFYFLTDPRNAWILLVTIQPFLAGIFMYLAIKSFKLPNIPALFGSITFMFSSYFITWLENGNVSQSYLWLPLTIFAINKFFEKFQFRYLLILTTGLALSIFAGHPQTVIYIIIATLLFFTYKLFDSKFSLKYFIYYFMSLAASLLLCSIQLLPTLSFYQTSPIHLPFARSVFDKSILPFQNLITFFASDFFGHPATNNFWSVSYGDFTPYFGVVPLVFSLWGIYKLFKNKFIKFATFTSAFFILASFKGPITFLITQFQIPLINATSPSRFLSITFLFLIIISAFGLYDFLENLKSEKYLKNFLKFITALSSVYILMWGFTFFGKLVLQPQSTWQINLSVTQHNLILPTAMFLAIPFLVITFMFIKKLKVFSDTLLTTGIILVIFVVTVIGGVYYSNKFLPVAPKKFIFPDHPILTWLKNNAGINRFYGGGTAHIDYNFPTHYQIFGVEGYDTLRLERYAQLLASSFSGKVPKTYLRSDGVVPEGNNGYRKRLFDLLGVKYILDKEDDPKTGADWHYERFPGDNIKGIVQYNRPQIYLREDALPRVFTSNNYVVAKNDEEIINDIYNPNFDLKTIILEKSPNIQVASSQGSIKTPQIISYLPNTAVFKTINDSNTILFLSDAYSKDWKAYVDNSQVPLLRADYAFRAVAVPQGEHVVKFDYYPNSFKYGLYLTIFSFLAIIVLSVVSILKKKF